MLGYIECALARFLYILPKHPQHSPFAVPLPVFGQAQQLTLSPDTSKPLNAIGIKMSKRLLVSCYI